ncbi:MAG: SpoVA/SpoVAEb family sporulation membrane protein [Clostridia bacterium]|jgi:stage V sporulation protein AE|nr:SpoVA/SpoVAEb family sporulation membrane protein [Clostridia bacterium]
MEYLEIVLMFLKAFAVGGIICLIAQIVINFTELTAGKILVLFMLAGVALTALGLYQPLVEFAGAGASVPISGFGYLLANGAMKGAQKGLFQALTGPLAAASAGVSAAVIFSFIMALIFKSHTKHN